MVGTWLHVAKSPPVHRLYHRTLEKGGRAGIRVPLFHTPTMCPHTDIFQAHREDVPARLNPSAQFPQDPHTLFHPSPVPGYNFFLL